MDCGVCEIRSTVGYCAACKKLLCEVCGQTCEHCGKRYCPDHIEQSRSGRVFCAGCLAEHRARKKAREEAADSAQESAEDEDGYSFAALQDDAPAETPNEGPSADVDRPILTASAYQPTPSWRQSLYAGGIGVLLAVLVWRAPGFRAVAQPWASIATIAAGCIAAAFAFAGLTVKTNRESRRWNLVGLVLGIVVIVLAVIALLAPRPPL